MMRNKIHYQITNLDDNSIVYVNTTEEIEKITGVERRLFYKMLPGELYIINHWKIKCSKSKFKNVKSLWRD